MKRNKVILSIFLILVILLVGVAVVFVSSKVSQEQAIAPTAPTSEPRAAETVWVGSDACAVTATSLCVASDVITCTPDCPTDCGKTASTISTCTNSCGVATTKACPSTALCGKDGGWGEFSACSTACGTSGTKTRTCNNPAPSNGGEECTKGDGTLTTPSARTETIACNALSCEGIIIVSKKAYKYVGGTYAYTTEIDTVAKNQTFIYAITIENLGEIDVTGVNITDTLNGEKQDQLSFVDAKSGCTYSASERKVTCAGLTVKAGEKGVYAFKVKVGGDAVNGDVIKNVAIVNAVGTDINAANELTISTVVGCNHTCTGDSECSSGLVCDTSTNKCRKEACMAEDTCSCPVVTAAPTQRPVVIRTPAPTRVVTVAPVTTTEVVEVVQPTVLPEAGILDFPGVAAFGGGLLLAIVGILLAL